jgi:hypothetical protein
MKPPPKYRPTVITLIAYLLGVLLIDLTFRVYPEPMCGPGPAGLCGLLSPVLIIAFFFTSLFKVLDGEKRHVFPLVLHGLVLAWGVWSVLNLSR